MSKKHLQKGFTHTNSKRSSGGFTIIELLIATIIFSMVLMVILSAFLQIGRMFYKGISVNNTNDAARNLVDAIAGEVRLGSRPYDNKPDPALGAGGGYFCVGTHRYTYKLGRQVKADQLVTPDASHIVAGVIQDTVSGCAKPSDGGGTNARQLLGPDMQLNNVDFRCLDNACSIQTHVVFYGAENTVFDSDIASWKNTSLEPDKASGAPDAYCSGNLLSTQFCASADINTNVTLGY